MRPIKFRAWDKRQGQMSATFTLVELTQYEHIFEVKFKHLARFDDLIWLEYTGLKDSLVTEEYFGDIIEEDDGTRRIVEDGASVVLFIAMGNKHAIKYFWDLRPHNVIGNIYENKELLNDNKD